VRALLLDEDLTADLYAVAARVDAARNERERVWAAERKAWALAHEA
jgi:hypothetical protein